jgi:hypothetical protein
MVERIMRNPDLASMTETEAAAPVVMRGGLCLICGEWVEPDTDDVFMVTLTRPSGEAAEYVAHAGCVARVGHPGARLPPPGGPMPEEVPDNYLAPKRRTPSGR